MRFRWNEHNAGRSAFFARLPFTHKKIAQTELIHSRTVMSSDTAHIPYGMQCDGIITRTPSVLPVITVADCMPIFIYEPNSACIGVLHSGWKGTGIVLEAFEKAEKHYGADIGNFRVILGPHIRNCCYTVDEQRARFFQTEFSPDCVIPVSECACTENKARDSSAESVHDTLKTGRYRLSLEQANRALLKKAGIQDEHIFSTGECTCCTKTDAGSYKYGSFRRETALLPESMSLEKKQRCFTPMAAFVGFKDDCFTCENLTEARCLYFLF